MRRYGAQQSHNTRSYAYDHHSKWIILFPDEAFWSGESKTIQEYLAIRTIKITPTGNKRNIFKMTTLLFFHPDSNRRLWNLTKSADLVHRQALAGWSNRVELPPVGNFAPPWRTFIRINLIISMSRGWSICNQIKSVVKYNIYTVLSFWVATKGVFSSHPDLFPYT